MSHVEEHRTLPKRIAELATAEEASRLHRAPHHLPRHARELRPHSTRPWRRGLLHVHGRRGSSRSAVRERLPRLQLGVPLHWTAGSAVSPRRLLRRCDLVLCSTLLDDVLAQVVPAEEMRRQVRNVCQAPACSVLV